MLEKPRGSGRQRVIVKSYRRASRAGRVHFCRTAQDLDVPADQAENNEDSIPSRFSSALASQLYRCSDLECQEILEIVSSNDLVRSTMLNESCQGLVDRLLISSDSVVAETLKKLQELRQKAKFQGAKNATAAALKGRCPRNRPVDGSEIISSVSGPDCMRAKKHFLGANAYVKVTPVSKSKLLQMPGPTILMKLRQAIA